METDERTGQNSPVFFFGAVLILSHRIILFRHPLAFV